VKVTYYHRKPLPGCHSIEKLFSIVRAALPPSICYSISTAAFSSKGFFRRLYICLEAAWRQGDVNHVTGDIHFVTEFLNRKKTILTIHDCVMLERLRGIRKAVLFYFWYWLPEKRSALITVVSESTKKEVLRYLRCDPAKIRVVHNCISPEFCPCPREFNDACPTILQIGTSENKNLTRVAESLEGIRCHLRIIGMLSTEQKRVLERHKIDYTNAADIPDEELLRNYEECDLVVFASTYEGFGLPIIEGNAVGRSVVTSNVYSMPEVAGEAACIVDPYDVESIRAGILRIIQDPEYRLELVRKGFNNVDRFRPQAVTAEYVKLYREIVSGKSCAG
jgi:glycosyltransferase involved in cell wall biosynthesis